MSLQDNTGLSLKGCGNRGRFLKTVIK